MSSEEGRPVITGLVALVSVAAAVGLVAAGVIMVGVRVLGLGGGGGSLLGSDQGASLIVPMPRKTHPAHGPSITLGTSSPTASPTQQATPRTHHHKTRISLQAGETTVAPMGRIDLTGTYPGGEGAVLNVQKLSNGTWQDFYSVSATVSGGQFATYIQTGTLGLNRFRVVDSDTHLASNPVQIRVR